MCCFRSTRGEIYATNKRQQSLAFIRIHVNVGCELWGPKSKMFLPESAICWLKGIVYTNNSLCFHYRARWFGGQRRARARGGGCSIRSDRHKCRPLCSLSIHSSVFTTQNHRCHVGIQYIYVERCAYNNKISIMIITIIHEGGWNKEIICSDEVRMFK